MPLTTKGVTFDRNFTPSETTVHAVVLQHVSRMVGLQQVVDTDDFDIPKFCTADAAPLRPMRPEPLIPTLIVIVALVDVVTKNRKLCPDRTLEPGRMAELQVSKPKPEKASRPFALLAGVLRATCTVSAHSRR